MFRSEMEPVSSCDRPYMLAAMQIAQNETAKRESERTLSPQLATSLRRIKHHSKSCFSVGFAALQRRLAGGSQKRGDYGVGPWRPASASPYATVLFAVILRGG